ncbi:PIN domain-containing protein [Polaromonas sp.]|uniref:PIN domain-containing protein n=1 Tax=Polaromonas sp. TaxID=1869339 RepID=UPI003267AEC4
MQIRVILDTNIFSGDRHRTSESFKALTRLSAQGLIQIILPYIVKREWQTQLVAQSREDFVNLLNAARDLVARGVPEDLAPLLRDLIGQAENRLEDVVAHATVSYQNWIQQNQVVEQELTLQLGANAMEAYFSGTPPFSAPKIRKHIPDSFLYQALAEQAIQYPVYFVSFDKELLNQCSKIGNLKPFENLNRLMADEAVQDLIAQQSGASSSIATDQELPSEMESQFDPIETLRKLQFSPDANTKITSYLVTDGAKMIAGTTFRSKSIPGDDKEAYVESFGELEDVEVMWDEAAYLGDFTYVLEYKGTGTMLVSYYVHKGDTWALERRKVHYQDHNSHVWEIEEETSVTVYGYISVTIDQDYRTGDDIAPAIVEMDIDSIERVILEEDDA